jgi:hypothetical protein
VRARYRLRQVANAVNLTTPLGLLLGCLGGARAGPGPGGLLLAPGYTWPVPPAPAFTVGNVVVLRRGREHLAGRPRLIRHEARHASQWAVCGGLPFLALYLLAAAWSWWLAGDPYSRNAFEEWAGLADGGYRRTDR